MLGLGACTGDLDLMPTDPRTVTPGTFSEDPEGYMEQVMADVYLQFATYGANGSASVEGFDGGMSTFQRAIFNFEEIPTDESNWLATGDANFGTLTYGIVAANNGALYGTYSRLMINVALCNDFIQTVNNGYFDLTESQQAKADLFIRQCKILRSGCYFYLIDLFGNVPYADETVEINSVPPQLSRSEIYNNVVATLEEVSSEYGNDYTAPYGYVGKAVADALLVKFYLNAGVYTGTAAWDKAYAKAVTLINALKGSGFQGSGLCNHYHQLFAYNNDQYSIGGSSSINEIIWDIPQNETYLKSFANSTFMLMGYITDSPDDSEWTIRQADYNGDGGWKCMSSRQQFVEQFDWDDATMGTSKDIRVKYWCTSAAGFSFDDNVLDQDHYGTNGFIPIKFINWALDDNGEIDTNASPTKASQIGGDYAMIRLAEIYLSAAEAALQGGGDKSVALTYVNYIRERAGLDPWSSADLTLANLQEERSRELYCENVRRTDLIRYGKWISGYNWDWKNLTRNGTDFPSTNNLFPLPSTVVSQAGYTQNPGY